MTNYQLTILRAIGDKQPVTSSALFRHCQLDIERDSFGYVLQTLVKQGLVNGGNRKPVWLTLRGRDKVDEI